MSGRDATGRRQPTRSVRTSTTRPANYYARPFSFRSSIGAAAEAEPAAPTAPGFFPAITYFTDGLAALPKEVMRHFTLLKETEGKAYQPDVAINELLNKIDQLPPPPKPRAVPLLQSFFGMSMNNSISGSANASVIDDGVPRSSQTVAEALTLPDEHYERRTELYRDLQLRLREMTMVLDEKNMVLSTANETLSRQLARLDTSMPYIEAEISEEARLGSNTHWALPHMKDLRRNLNNGTERSRRDAQAAASLAAAAAAMHENDAAASRSEARREAMLAKRGHRNHNVDSDFDGRQAAGRKTQAAKARKEERSDARAPQQAHKRRRVEKPTSAAMERTASTATNSRAPASREGPRESGAAEPKKKRAAPAAPAPRRRNTANSPSIASSPTRPAQGSFKNRESSPAGAPMQRVGSSRGRHNPALAAINEQRGRPGSSQSQSRATTEVGDAKATGASTGTPRHSISRANGVETATDHDGDVGMTNTANGTNKPMEALKREETEPIEDAKVEREASSGAAPAQRSRGGSRTSKPGTPVSAPSSAASAAETLAATGMSRSRSTRGVNHNNHSNNAGASNGNGSMSNGNTAPKLDTSTEHNAKSPPTTTITSPRRSHKKGASAAAAAAAAAAAESVEVQGADGAADDDEDDQAQEEEINEDDDNEPTYCHCGGVSYGNMVACDNDDCPREWFHLACVDLARMPSKKEKWYCSDECREAARRSSRR